MRAGPAPRWSVSQRLDFMVDRLFWESGVNRADVIGRFGVSENQATVDFGQLRERLGAALSYDPRAKHYVASAPLPLNPELATQRLLGDLRLVCEGVIEADATALRACPPLGLASLPMRRVDPGVLRALIHAIRDGHALEARYASFNTPDVRRRRIEPHALVFDGLRWHARAGDPDDGRFKDFVLARLSDPSPGGKARLSSQDDAQWHTKVRLIFAPHPDLADFQQAAIAADFGMVGGLGQVETREATLLYVRARLGLTQGWQARRAVDQQIVEVRVERAG